MPIDVLTKGIRKRLKSIVGQQTVTSGKKIARGLSLRVKNGIFGMSLDAIGHHLGTDKVDRHHRFNGLSYLSIYEQYFEHRQKEQLNLLEIGVKNGASLKTWKTYFPNAKIFGIDIDPSCRAFEEPRISIATGSQEDESFLRDVFTPGRRFDIIIDDGSHINRHIIRAFDCLFYNRLNPGGIYIIEDLGCSYEPLQTKYDILNNWPGMKYNDSTQDFDNRRQDMDAFFADKINLLDHQGGEILAVHFWSMLCVILKKTSDPGNGSFENK